MSSPTSDIDKQSKYVRLAYPAYKVFIFGVNVSADVLAVNMTMHDGSSPNQCTITLNNELDKYIMTTNDMLWYKEMDGSKLKLPWMDANKGPGITDAPFVDPLTKDRGVLDPVKRLILLRKGTIKDSVSMSDRKDVAGEPLDTNKQYFKYFGSAIDKYPLSDGRPIIHPMDPVRVFFRDPFNPSRWYHMFCGFVSDMVDTNTENNAKTLSITVEDPTKLLRYQRVFMNPGILDAKTMVQKDGDIVQQSFWTNKFHDYTLPEVLFTLMFGYDYGKQKVIEKGTGPLTETARRTLFTGVGHFSWDTSVVCTIGSRAPAGSAQSQQDKEDDILGGVINLAAGERTVPVFHLENRLDHWQLLLDHEVQATDMHMMATPADRASWPVMLERREAILDKNGDPDIERVMNYIGSYPDKYPVDGGRLMLLMPRSLGVHNNSILLKDIITSYPLQSDSVSLGSMIMETLTRLEFSMYCSPRGDIVAELPLYDFDPDNFGVNELKADSIQGTFAAIGGNKYTPMLDAIGMFGSGTNRGPYGLNYVVLKNDTMNWENAHIDQNVYTVAVTKHAIFQNWDNLPYSDITGDLELARREELIPLYGYRQAPITARGYLSTKRGALLYANICLNRLNADAHTLRVSHVPNIKLWINRPVYIQGRNTIATTKSLSHSITWGAQGDMSTTSDLYAGRTWNGDVSADDPTRPIFTSITGYGTTTLNYAVLFGIAPPPNYVERDAANGARFTDATPDYLASILSKVTPEGG